VPTLGRAWPRTGGCRQAVAFDDLDLLKVLAKAPAIDSPPIPAPTTTARRPKIPLMLLRSRKFSTDVAKI
jgi:hypothetical protein